MKTIQLAAAEQVVSISKARAELSKLVDKVKEKDFFLISRKYAPKAVLVDIRFMDKLLSVYQKWQRQKDLAAMEEVWEKIPKFPSKEIEQDVKDAIRQIRKKN